MKPSLYLIFLFLLTIACKKESEQNQLSPTPVLPNHIVTGDTSSESIIYTKLNPADTLRWIPFTSNETRQFDIDKDGINDFEFRLYGTSNPNSTLILNTLKSLSQNEIVISDTLVAKISPGVKIDSTLQWGKYSLLYFYSYKNLGSITDTAGLWKNSFMYYAGIRLNKNQNSKYGWIKLSITEGERIVIHEFAICK